MDIYMSQTGSVLKGNARKVGEVNAMRIVCKRTEIRVGYLLGFDWQAEMFCLWSAPCIVATNYFVKGAVRI